MGEQSVTEYVNQLPDLMPCPCYTHQEPYPSQDHGQSTLVPVQCGQKPRGDKPSWMQLSVSSPWASGLSQHGPPSDLSLSLWCPLMPNQPL